MTRAPIPSEWAGLGSTPAERRGMDTSLVMRAQRGDEEAFASLNRL
jgi:hypothetical protein